MSETPHDTAPPEAPQASRSPRRLPRPSAGDLLQRFGLVLAWAIVAIFFAIKLPDTFPVWGNWAQTIFGSPSSVVVAIVALGLLVPLTTGDYDLSIGATLALSANTVAILNVNHGWSIWAAALAGLVVGAIVGTVNGGFVVIFGVDPFIVTLGMATFLQGIVYWISASQNITGVSSVLSKWTIQERLFGIPVHFYYAVALAFVIWYVFEFTPLGRRLLFVGRGRNVSRLSGIRVDRMRWGALIASATIAGLAGVLYAGAQGSSDPTSGSAFLLPAYAAAFLGATAIQPGRFNPWGTLIAVYFLATGINGLQLLGVPSYVQQLFYGGALVLAVALSQITRQRTEGSEGRLPTWVLGGLLALIGLAFVGLLVYLGVTQTS
jgi:ribose transport system permease protein